MGKTNPLEGAIPQRPPPLPITEPVMQTASTLRCQTEREGAIKNKTVVRSTITDKTPAPHTR